ncbi:SAC3 family protein C isoform X1 [Cryptomeria japonica]|uniref:SAC3 family protein C isoform X1 n=1 Tax=Cryptomeria japonica TaxID=3369 RepID=UPI0027D9F8F6|nr:SAC3 family protein C isoform X1 [Cryptomeria japonica]
MERNRARYEGNYSRGRTHGGRFRNGRANLNQPIYNQRQDDGTTDKFPSHTQQPPNSSFPRQHNNRRPSSSYLNSGESQGPSNNFINNSNKYRGQGHENSHPPSLDTSTVLTNADLEEEDSQRRPFLTGTCPDMCPAKERTQREQLRDLAVFERLNGNPHKTSAKLAVKKFCRTISISEIQTSDIRPLPVLLTAMEYLLELVDTSEHAFAVVHDFVFDRTRAIRQELMMQNITSHEAIIMHEQMVRFHILSQHKLYQLSSNEDTSMLHLNFEQLSKCLRSLLDLYNANMKSSSEAGCQAEFNSYYVLANMRSHSLPQQGESLSLWFQTVRPTLLKSKEMKFARNVLRCYHMGNFKGFFTLAREATYLEACLMECYFNEVRAQAVACINHSSYKLSPFPLCDLAGLLMMTESDTEDFCNLCGLATSTDDRGFKSLIVKQFNFSFPEKGSPYYNCPIIEGKLDSSYCLEIRKKKLSLQ